MGSYYALKGHPTTTLMNQQSKQPARRPVGWLKGYSHKTSTQKRELENSSKPNRIKGILQRTREKYHG
jgi:hypothetical protein